MPASAPSASDAPPAEPADGPTGPAAPRRVPLRPLPVVTDRCTGCGRCVAACPPKVLSLGRRGWDKISELHDAAGCTGCSLCAAVCPFDAIRMTRPTPVAAGLPPPPQSAA